MEKSWCAERVGDLMRDELGGAARDVDTPRLPWAAWVRTLPGAARDRVSHVDLSAPYVYLDLPALAQELPGARAQLRRWSQAVHLTAELVEDVVLAVDEALANAVEHAYEPPAGRPSTVTVFAGRLTPDPQVYVVVSDAGHWRLPPVHAGVRGRGVAMMKALADHFDLHHNENGTTVLLGWNAR
jgi:serine/threonine-protein kinase RsbW